MIKYANHLMARLPYELLVLAMIFAVASPLQLHEATQRTCIIAALVLACCFLFGIIRQWVLDHNNDALLAHDRIEALTDRISKYLMVRKEVDIWTSQEALMRASDQRLPSDGPIIHKGVLLYAALMAEELGETLKELADEMAINLMEASYDEDPPSDAATALSIITDQTRHQASMLGDYAGAIRSRLTYVSDQWSFTPSAKGAEMLLDGATDIAVVVAGFGLAAGLPAREGYAECMGSNLSKANPRTGKIDKDASGKWIKGSAYRPADFWRVLAEQRARIEQRLDEGKS